MPVRSEVEQRDPDERAVLEIEACLEPGAGLSDDPVQIAVGDAGEVDRRERHRKRRLGSFDGRPPALRSPVEAGPERVVMEQEPMYGGAEQARVQPFADRE